MCNEKIIYAASINLPDITNDTISSIGGFSLSPAKTAAQIADDHLGQFWIEQNVDGEDMLCTVKITDGPVACTYTHSSVVSTTNSQPFILVGGHPVRKPGGKPA